MAEITYEDVKKCFRMLKSNCVQKPYNIYFAVNNEVYHVKGYSPAGCWRKIRRKTKEIKEMS